MRVGNIRDAETPGLKLSSRVGLEAELFLFCILTCQLLIYLSIYLFIYFLTKGLFIYVLILLIGLFFCAF